MLATESDPEMLSLAKEELANLEEKVPTLEEAITLALLPKDPNDEKNVMLEVRAGAGGDEASLFARELSNAYMIFAKAE